MRQQWSWIIISAVVIVIVGSTLPTILAQSDEFETTLLDQGRRIFEETAGGIGCASCHGHFALGDLDIAPNIRGADEGRIREALDTVQTMDFLDLTDEEVVAVATFVGRLGELVPAKAVIRRSVIQTAELTDPPTVEFTVPDGVEVQLIFENVDRTRDYMLISEEIGIEELLVPARDATDFVWTPLDEGTFTVLCTNCQNGGAQLTITVSQPD